MPVRYITLNAETARLWSWFARVGLGPKFGTLPIGWYQLHMDAVERELTQRLCSLYTYGPDHPLRVRAGSIFVRTTLPGYRGRWVYVGEVSAIYSDALSGACWGVK